MKLKENQKITLTLGQLRDLVKESASQEGAKLAKVDRRGFKKIFASHNEADDSIFIFGANSLEGLTAVLEKYWSDEEDNNYSAKDYEKIWNIEPGKSLLLPGDANRWYNLY